MLNDEKNATKNFDILAIVLNIPYVIILIVQ